MARTSLVARRRVGDVRAEHDPVEGGPVRSLRGGVELLEEVDGFGPALLVEDEDSGARSVKRVERKRIG